MPDGPVPDPPRDRFGRDGARTPMQWDATSGGGFSAGTPWLAPGDPSACNVADQERDRGSVLWLYRDLIALRRDLGPDLRFVDSDDAVLAYRRGEVIVALNLGAAPAPAPAHGEVLLGTAGGVGGGSVLDPGTGWIARCFPTAPPG
jgi:alpha-glucosidase